MMKGYEQKKYPVATKRYVQWLELESDEEAIREYRRLHSEGVQWKEIRVGILQVCGSVWGCGRESVRLVSWRWRFSCSATDW